MATVVAFEEGAGLVLELDGALGIDGRGGDGGDDRVFGTGQSCIVRGDAEDFSALESGRRVPVYDVRSQPGRCEFVSTVEASEALLRVLASVTVVLLLLILLLTSFLHRALNQPGKLTSRFDNDQLRRIEGVDAVTGAARMGVACPQCQKPMREGALPLLAGLHWREPGEPVGIPNALAGLPGTTSWRGRPILHAYRCDPCEVLLVKHGRLDPDDLGPISSDVDSRR